MTREAALRPVIRWTYARKLDAVTAVRLGHISIEELCQVHRLTQEEFTSWWRAYERFGAAGLRERAIPQRRAG